MTRGSSLHAASSCCYDTRPSPCSIVPDPSQPSDKGEEMMMHSASITSGIRPTMRSLLLVSQIHNPRARPPPLPLLPCPSPSLQVPSNFICASRPLVSCRSYAAATSVEHPLLPPSGEIHVILGPMFAGKTTALMQRVQLEINQGKSAALIKSDKDTRYGLDSIVSHDGVKMPCWALPDLSGFPAKLGAQAYRKLDVIGIDEAQFFGDLYEFCKNAADHDGKTVIVAGLDGDYLRRSFGSVLDLIPLADSVTKLTAQCELCGGPAFFTLRKTKETQTELIGGADVYMPVCRQHYVSGQIVVEAARIVLEAQKIKV